MDKRKLLDRVEEEYHAFRNRVLKYDQADVYNKAYEIVHKEEIYNLITTESIPPKNVIELLKQDNIMEYIYGLWQKTEHPIGESLKEIMLSENAFCFFVKHCET